MAATALNLIRSPATPTPSTAPRLTGVVAQYAGDGLQDPHVIFAQLPSVKNQYRCFFSTFLATGIAVVPGARAALRLVSETQMNTFSSHNSHVSNARGALMPKQRVLLSILGCAAIAACAKPPPTSPTVSEEPMPTSLTGSEWPAHFAKLSESGATFELVNALGGDSGDRIKGRVARASETVIELSWTINDQLAEDPMPTEIRRVGESVVIDGVAFTAASASLGDTITTNNDVTCYEEGPEPNAGDCEDICFASICFHETIGVVELGGHWSVSQEPFASPRCNSTAGAPLSCQ